MDFIKETDLPGVGKKFKIASKDGDEIIIIVHDDGVREIYHINEDSADDVEYIISFDDNEARKVAGILGGLSYTPKAVEAMRVDLKELTIDWHKFGKNEISDSKSIGDLQVRKNTGVSIIAIIKKDRQSIVNPGPEVLIQVGDTLVLAGTREQIKAFHKFIYKEEN